MAIQEVDTFNAYQTRYESDRRIASLTKLKLDQLDQGDVLIRSMYSSVNYKDALGATDRGKIYKKYPIVGGIDVGGTIVESSHPHWKVGDEVLVTGCGLGESHDGGYSEFVRVPGDWPVSCPKGLTLREGMILGTAGFTAGLCLHRLLQNEQTPDKGPIVVTGASGGVGSLCIPMLKKLGFTVIAVSGKSTIESYLRKLGADQVLAPEELSLGHRPLEQARFGGAIDNVGGKLLEGLFRHINLWGNIACVGLAGGHEFHNTVMPLILRGVSLLGISSTNCPRPLRLEIWRRLAADWKPDQLSEIVHQTVTLNGLDEMFHKILERQVTGRVLVKI